MTDTPHDEPNEIVAAAAAAKARSVAAAKTIADRTQHWPLAKIGLGVGIGSAAIAGALLYARRDREPEEPSK